MGRRLGSVVLALALLSCGEETSGPTVSVDALPYYFDFSDPDVRFPVGAEICVVRPVTGPCAIVPESGVVPLEVPADAEVLLRVEGPDILPLLLPFRTEREPLTSDFPVYEINVVNAVAVALGSELDPAAGQVTCSTNPVQDANAGQTYALVDPETGEEVAAPFYLSETGLPDPRVTVTAANGFGGFVNAPPGEWAIESTFNDRCPIVRYGWPGTGPDGSPVIRAPVEAGAITLVQWNDCRAP